MHFRTSTFPYKNNLDYVSKKPHLRHLVKDPEEMCPGAHWRTAWTDASKRQCNFCLRLWTSLRWGITGEIITGQHGNIWISTCILDKTQGRQEHDTASMVYTLMVSGQPRTWESRAPFLQQY